MSGDPKTKLRKNLNWVLRTFLRDLLKLPENYFRAANDGQGVGAEHHPFGTLLISNINREGNDSTLYDNAVVGDNVVETVSGEREVVCSVQFFREGALNNAVRLYALLYSDVGAEKMRELGIGLTDVSDVRDLTAIEDQTWEERSSIDITFSVASVEQIEIGSIGSFELGLLYQSPGGKITKIQLDKDLPTKIDPETGE
jgi:hypothetical protein